MLLTPASTKTLLHRVLPSYPIGAACTPAGQSIAIKADRAAIDGKSVAYLFGCHGRGGCNGGRHACRFRQGPQKECGVRTACFELRRIMRLS